MLVGFPPFVTGVSVSIAESLCNRLMDAIAVVSLCDEMVVFSTVYILVLFFPGSFSCNRVVVFVGVSILALVWADVAPLVFVVAVHYFFMVTCIIVVAELIVKRSGPSFCSRSIVSVLSLAETEGDMADDFIKPPEP